MSEPAAPPQLNPAQAEAEGLLREPRQDRPVHRRELRDDLRDLLHEGLADLLVVDPPLRLTKRLLEQVHGCEDRFLHEQRQPFVATAAMVRGVVAHKAIELSVHAPGHSPGRLVDHALDRLGAGQDWAGDWLAGADPLERAEARALACDRVAKFLECFPPLRNGWRPVTESRLSSDLLGGLVRLTGKVDLTIGGADGLRSGKVVIDLKTGGRSPAHVEDLRFYALIETLRLGVPPWKVASYYLDDATFVFETVTEGLLEAAARRVVAGAYKLVELQDGTRAPRRIPGPLCPWCPLYDGCEDGRRAREAREAGG